MGHHLRQVTPFVVRAYQDDPIPKVCLHISLLSPFISEICFFRIMRGVILLGWQEMHINPCKGLSVIKQGGREDG